MGLLENSVGHLSSDRNWFSLINEDAAIYVRPTIFAIFTILQTMLIIGFTADCLLVAVRVPSKNEKMAQKLIQSIYILDVIILSVFATEIVTSITYGANVFDNWQYSCSRTDLQFFTKAITIIWISTGIAFARLTLVEIFSYSNARQTKPKPEKLYTFTKILIYYTFLSVILFAVPVMIQSLPVYVICVPMPQTNHKYTLIYLTIIILVYGVMARCTVLAHTTDSNKLQVQNRPAKILNSIKRIFPFMSITFLTLFPFILLTVRTSHSFNMYKIFAFYVTLSLSNITVNRIYSSRSLKQMKKYQYYIV